MKVDSSHWHQPGHIVCHLPQKRPSFMFPDNCWLFSLDWGPGWFQFLLPIVKLSSMWAPLSSLHLIWQYCLKSAHYCYSALVLECSVVRRDGCDHTFILESSSEVCHAVFLPASPAEDFPVLGASCGDRKEDRWPKEVQLGHSHWDQLLAKDFWGITVANIQPQGVLTEALQALSLPLGTSWLPVPWAQGFPNGLGPSSGD